ncbi:MAG: OprO/OprP family phosphate-selective porin [Saprospiraceae bacterium]|nr:OprO/OprP family phosphate-selective porin [Saprospiraceae bacterium]HMW39349.1 porin [Saprospiraceae bacterium]HMX89517.1 porin [Saprospiraceae bacterium]HMZ41330.1 porin [Saprospiraceae bacterium]HNA65015.1 porin [Saprospiraceae bacterium]
MKLTAVLAFSLAFLGCIYAQDTVKVAIPSEKKVSWFDKISIRGYGQVRYNRLLETNKDLKCEQCDKSWGDNGGFFIRRMRIVFFGQISPRLYFYVQPDLASAVSATTQHFAQIRDAYLDLGLDSKNEFRFRIGQSKVPYGFENMQSSQNRLPLDRNDALNSAVPNERDLGVFFYWAPEKKRHLFSSLIKEGLKGSGDYGIFALGLFNGQTANKPELNNHPHIVARASYPMKIGQQIVEASLQGYQGHYVVAKDQLSTGVKYKSDLSYQDSRVAGSFVLYPKPWGLVTEYNIGKGPEYNKITDSIETRNLHGGYVQLNYKLNIGHQLLYPFTRYQYYEGGKKLEKDARSYTVKELEFGLEWQPFPAFELTAMYTISDRRFEDFTLQDNRQKGNLLRLQAQFNF